MSECDQFRAGSRKHKICTGVADIPKERINVYRRNWGLPPLTEFPDVERKDAVVHIGNRKIVRTRGRARATSCQGCTSQPRRMAQTPDGPGSELKRAMKQMGLPSCQACKDLAAKMDEWGVAGCRQRQDEIIEDIMPRARDWVDQNHPWASAMFPNCVKDIEIRRRVTRYVNEAIQRAELRDQHRNRLRRHVFRPKLDKNNVVWNEDVEPIVRIIPAVRTSLRQKATIGDTLTSLERGGFEPAMVFAEPNARLTFDPYMRFDRQLKPFLSFQTMAEHLVGQYPHDWLLLCEDDVDFKRGAADDLRALLLDQTQMVSLYVSMDQAEHVNIEPGINSLTGDLHGSLAYLIHSTALRTILASNTFENWTEEARVDRAVSQAAEDCEIAMLVHHPALCQHTGETSTIRSSRRLTSGRLSSFIPEISERPLLTLITPTGDRPEAFALCERWISRQRYQGEIQWIVVDDGHTPTKCTMGQLYIQREPMDGHTLCANLREAIPHIRGDRLLIIEDDEYYGPDYLSVMTAQLQHADFVGERASKYYFVRERKWIQYPAWHHVALCRIGMQSAVYMDLKRAVGDSDHPSVDQRLWNYWTGSRRVWMDERGDMRLGVGMKGLPGRECGVKIAPINANDDKDGTQLRLMLGGDWKSYWEAKGEK